VTGQRHCQRVVVVRTSQHNSTTTIASVIEPMACPLGKLYVVSAGDTERQRSGRKRTKVCFATTFSSSEPRMAVAAKTPSRIRRNNTSASTSSASAGTTPQV